MSQISRPLLVALVAVVGFAGAWMTVLRPRAESGGDSAAATPVAAAAAPGTKGLGRAAKGAQGAVAASEASAKRATAAAGSDAPAEAGEAAAAPAGSDAPPAGETASATGPTPAAPAPAPKPAVDGRITVVLFAGRGADDDVAREVVRGIHGRGVRVVVAPVAHVSRYTKLIGSVQITGSPTTLVIGRDHKAQRFVGLIDEAQITQALAAARRRS